MKVSWNKARLDKCAEIVSGATPSTSVKAHWNGDICWATPKDLSSLESTYISGTSRKITRTGLDSCGATILPVGSVLFSSRAPIGHVAINTVPMATNQGFKSFIPHPDTLDAKYLYWWLRTKRVYLKNLGNGATFKEVSKPIVSRIEIPLPSLTEQRRIAEILDRAGDIRAKRRAAIAQVDSVTHSIFLDLFGDPVINPKQFQKKNLGQLLRVRSGESVLVSELSDSGEFPVYGGNGINGYHNRFMFESPVIVIGRVGVYCGVVHVTNPKAWVTDNALFVTDFSSDLEFCYLAEALKIANLNQYAGRMAQPLVSGSRIYPVEILVPSKPLQREFRRRVEVVEKLKKMQRTSLAELDNLFASLQHRAFRGEL